MARTRSLHLGVALALCCGALVARSIGAQQPGTEQIDRPGTSRPTLPLPGAPAPLLILPRIAPPQSQPETLSGQIQVLVKRIRITGNTVLADSELAEITRLYENRVVSSEELQELRQRLTLAYVDRGYINSGALLVGTP